MKKYASWITLILLILSRFTQAMNHSEAQEKNRKSGSYQSASSSSSSSSSSSASYPASAPCMASVPPTEMTTQTQMIREQILIAPARTAISYGVLTNQKAPVTPLTTPVLEKPSTTTNALSSWSSSSCSISISDLDRRNGAASVSQEEQSLEHIKKRREKHDRALSKIAPFQRDPGKLILQYYGIHNVCPRLWAGQWHQEAALEKWKPRSVAHRSQSNCHECDIILSNNGAYIASQSDEYSAHIWKTSTGACLGTLQGHTGSIRNILFSHDNKFIATQSSDRTARIWDIETQKCIHILQNSDIWADKIAFSPDGRFLATGSNNTLCVWDTNAGYCFRTLPHSNWFSVEKIIFGPNGKYITIEGTPNSTSKTVPIWDVATGKIVHELQEEKVHKHVEACILGHGITSIAFSPNGKYIATQFKCYNADNRCNNILRIWDAKTGKPLHTLEQSDKFEQTSAPFTFSPDGRYIASSLLSAVCIWDINTGKCIHRLKGHKYPVLSVAFNATSNHIISGSIDGTVRLWDTNTGTCLYTLQNNTEHIESTAFSPDSKILINNRKGAPALWQSSANMDNLTAEQTKFLILCETATAAGKMPLYLIARKTGLKSNALRATFYSFNYEMQELMRKTYGLSDTSFMGPVAQSAVSTPMPSNDSQSSSSNSSSSHGFNSSVSCSSSSSSAHFPAHSASRSASDPYSIHSSPRVKPKLQDRDGYFENKQHHQEKRKRKPPLVPRFSPLPARAMQPPAQVAQPPVAAAQPEQSNNASGCFIQ